MSTRAILLDFGGTLDSNGIPWLDRFYPLYLNHGIRVSREDFAEAFYAADDRLAARFKLDGLGLAETVTLQTRCVMEALAPGRLDAAEPIAAEFLSDGRESLRRNRRLLERWRRKYALGVVSNFYGNMESVLREEGLRPLFDVVIDSTAVGRLKPDPGIFHRALDVIGIPPAETWMVGDSVPRDMKGAEAAGLRHAWLRGARMELDACCPQAVVLDRLESLEIALESPFAVERR